MQTHYLDNSYKQLFHYDNQIMGVKYDKIVKVNPAALCPTQVESGVVLMDSKVPSTTILENTRTKHIVQMTKTQFVFVKGDHQSSQFYLFEDNKLTYFHQTLGISLICRLSDTKFAYTTHAGHYLFCYNLENRELYELKLIDKPIFAMIGLSNGHLCCAINKIYKTLILIIDQKTFELGCTIYAGIDCIGSRTVVMAELDPMQLYVGFDRGKLEIYDLRTHIYHYLFDIPDDCPLTHIINLGSDKFITANCRGAIHIWQKNGAVAPKLMVKTEGSVYDLIVKEDLILCSSSGEFCIYEIDVSLPIPYRVWCRTQKIRDELIMRVSARPGRTEATLTTSC